MGAMPLENVSKKITYLFRMASYVGYGTCEDCAEAIFVLHITVVISSVATSSPGWTRTHPLETQAHPISLLYFSMSLNILI